MMSLTGRMLNAVSSRNSICSHGDERKGVQPIANFLTRKARRSGLISLLMTRIINGRLQQLFLRDLSLSLLFSFQPKELFSRREFGTNQPATTSQVVSPIYHSHLSTSRFSLVAEDLFKGFPTCPTKPFGNSL